MNFATKAGAKVMFFFTLQNYYSFFLVRLDYSKHSTKPHNNLQNIQQILTMNFAVKAGAKVISNSSFQNTFVRFFAQQQVTNTQLTEIE